MFRSADAQKVLEDVYTAIGRDAPPSSYSSGKVTLEFKDGAVYATIQEVFLVGEDYPSPEPEPLAISETNLPAS